MAGRKCNAGLNWRFCRRKEGCKHHYSTATFPTYSAYADTDGNETELDSGSDHNPPGPTNTPTPALVRENAFRVGTGGASNSRNREEPAFDDDGYPIGIKWIGKHRQIEWKEESPVEEPTEDDTRIRSLQTYRTSNVITRSRGRQIEAKKKEEESRNDPTTEKEVVNWEEDVEMESLDEEKEQQKGKQKEQEPELAEWKERYMKDLTPPKDGWPTDMWTGVIRTVDDKEYRLDEYPDMERNGRYTPFEINVYNAGYADPSFLPAPFRMLDYSTPFGRTILKALENDPIATTVTERTGQPYRNTPLGYILINRPNKDPRVYIPEGPFTPTDTGIQSTIRNTIISEAHHELGHQGKAKTYLRIAGSCYWPKMYQDVEEYVTTCIECQLNKQPTSKPAGLAHVLPIPERPWESIAIDFAGPLNDSYGFQNIMIIMDRFSGFILCFPLTANYSARDVANVFMHLFYGRYGLPQSIVSDRDTRFTSKFWQGLQKTVGIELLMSTAFHQSTNGQVERANKTVMQMLRIFANGTGSDWSQHLWRAERQHNFAKATWIDKTPFEMVYGRAPIEIPTELPESSYPAVEAYLDTLITHQRVAHDALLMARFRQAETVNKRRNPNITFEAGDYALYQRRTTTGKKAKKLHTVWVGPYRIKTVNEETGNCLLEIPDELKIHPWFAQDKLKKFKSRDGTYPEPVQDKDTKEEEYEVNEILEYDRERNRYLVSWKGYPPEENQWEPAHHLQNAPEKIDTFWQTRGGRNEALRAYRNAIKIDSNVKRTAKHSRLIHAVPQDFFYPSDDTDGNGEGEGESFC
jgi:transposase InsO family protein